MIESLIDYFVLAYRNVIKRKLRAWLTMLGIFVGIAAVVSLISLGQGMQEYINEQFEAMGSDKILVSASGGMGVSSYVGLSGSQLSEKDVEAIKSVKGIDLVATSYTKSVRVEFRKEIEYTFASGIPSDKSREIYTDMENFRAAKGRMPKGKEDEVMIGDKMANGYMFGNRKVSVGDVLKINGKNFKVVGVMAPIGNRMDDSSIIMDIDILRNLYNEKDVVHMIIADVSNNYDVSSVAERVEEKLRITRDVKKGKEDFDVQTAEQLIKTYNDILGAVQAVVIGIAAISLIVGGIGIMNTLYTSVLERTREIGIMKAVGAKNSHVLLIFLIESGYYGLVGGGVGCIIGIILSKSVEFAARTFYGIGMLYAYVSIPFIFAVLCFSFFIGVISGVLPAIQATKLKVVDALRYE